MQQQQQCKDNAVLVVLYIQVIEVPVLSIFINIYTACKSIERFYETV